MTYWPGYPPPTPPKPPWYRNLMVWLWVYVGLAAVGVVAFLVFVFSDVGTFEGWEDGYYYVEQDSVNSAVLEPCRDMARAGREIEVFATPAEGAEALHRFVTAGRAIPDAINEVDDADSGALQWRDDWITLLDALDSYADDLAADPKAEFAPPDGLNSDSLMFDMSWVSDIECELPPAILALDPGSTDDPW